MEETNKIIFLNSVFQVVKQFFCFKSRRPFKIISGVGLLRKFQQYRRLPQEPPTNTSGQGHHLEEELGRLTGKIVRLRLKTLQFTEEMNVFIVHRTISFVKSMVKTRRRPVVRRRSVWCAGPTERACRPCPAVTRSAVITTSHLWTINTRSCVGNASSAQFRWLWPRSVFPSGVSCAEPRC